MPNKNYLSGRRKEYKIKRQLELEGWYVLRSAGSHGFADLVAISPLKRKVRFIQCKPDNFSETQLKKLNDFYSWVQGGFEVGFEVI
jgi:Holliday junction resolvase